ncbi:MAG: hypothetical protein ACLVAU_13180 [Ruminococcus sp.]
MNSRYADVIVEGGEYTEGEYTFDVTDAMETEGQDDTIKREKNMVKKQLKPISSKLVGKL